MPLRINVSDLLSRPGHDRSERGTVPVAVTLPNAAVPGEASFDVSIRSLSDGVVVRGTATATAELTCTRCLSSWTSDLAVPVEQVYRTVPDDEEDELPVEPGGWIDVEPAVHDEVALALPTTPLCRPDCRGLCPTCGTDLNTDPCDGHGDDEDSPFAVLRDLFDS
jgi:uncharacterized protein